MAANVSSYFRSAKLFRNIETAILEELAEGCQIIYLREGETREVNRSLFLVCSGGLRVSGQKGDGDARALYEIGPGDSTGEMCLFSSDRSNERITAIVDTEMVEVPRTVFTALAERHPRAAIQITQMLGLRMQQHRLAAALHLGPLFAGIPADVLRDLATEMELMTLYGGETLFRQGDPGDFLCFVISGHLRVSLKLADGKARQVAYLGPGEMVGEMALAMGEARSATVVAMRDSQLAKLSKEGLDRFVIKHPTNAVRLVTRKLAERLRATTEGRSPERPLRTIAIVPVHPSSPVQACSRALAEALAYFGSTACLNSQGVDDHLGQPGISQSYERGGANLRLSEWLYEVEFEHRYLIYEADPHPSPWTERTLRQADHILLVADSDSSPDPGEIELELLMAESHRPLPRQWLVLVHREGTSPAATIRWLRPRKVERHFHVRLADSASFARLARLVSGRAMGLTLGGGFARGLAHLGVFQAMEELDVGIDSLGGASMGALVGALRAMQWDSERIRTGVSAACADKFGDLTFPFVAFKTGRSFSNAVRNLIADVQIEDLWIPYFCISANLNRAELEVHTRGSLAKAILAATRAPGVFPPIIYNGELHVDGGVINNVPVDLMRPFVNNGIVVGVDVSPPHELRVTPDYGDQLSGWSAARQRWKHHSEESGFMPSILLVMIRTLEYTGISYKSERTKSADIYMSPDLLKFKRTDFHLATEIARAAYDCAQQALREWKTSDNAAVKRPDLYAAAHAETTGR